MLDEIFESIIDIIVEVLTGRKPKNKDLKNIRVNNSYNLTHSNKNITFNMIKDYYKKRVGYLRETKVITEIVGLDKKRAVLGYTENGTGKLIEIKRSTY